MPGISGICMQLSAYVMSPSLCAFLFWHPPPPPPLTEEPRGLLTHIKASQTSHTHIQISSSTQTMLLIFVSSCSEIICCCCYIHTIYNLHQIIPQYQISNTEICLPLSKLIWIKIHKKVFRCKKNKGIHEGGSSFVSVWRTCYLLQNYI